MIGFGSFVLIFVWGVRVVFLGMLLVRAVRARRMLWAVVTSAVWLCCFFWFGWKQDFTRSLFQLRGWLDWVELGMYITMMLATPLWLVVDWVPNWKRGVEGSARP